MKAVTEFANFTLSRALKTKADLAATGKTPEEIQTSLGESFKFEGDKLKYFVNAIEVAAQNQENLKRVLVLSLNEGENAPAKAIKFEELYYLPEIFVAAAPVASSSKGKGGRGGRRDKDGGKKGSPWGLTPEEKAAKSGKAAAAAKDKA